MLIPSFEVDKEIYCIDSVELVGSFEEICLLSPQLILEIFRGAGEDE
jgi:hypothetical protein